MDYMELQFPGDVREAHVRERRNISETERWISMAAGLGLAAYGLSRRRTGGWALMVFGGVLFRRGYSGHCGTYEFLGLNSADTAGDTRLTLGGSGGVIVEESVTINGSVEELYRFWRHLENLPRFMDHLASVERVTESLSRWHA